MNIDKDTNKIEKCIFSSKNKEQLRTCLRMLTLFRNKWYDKIDFKEIVKRNYYLLGLMNGVSRQFTNNDVEFYNFYED